VLGRSTRYTGFQLLVFCVRFCTLPALITRSNSKLPFWLTGAYGPRRLFRGREWAASDGAPADVVPVAICELILAGMAEPREVVDNRFMERVR